MKNLINILILTLLLAACTPAPPPVPTTEEAINRDAEMLIRISLTDRLMADSKSYYNYQASSLLKQLGKTPEEAQAMIDDVMLPLMETEHRRLLDFVVPIYRRYYTPDEIHQLLSFYQTEAMQKSMKVSSHIADELSVFWQEWGEQFGELFLKQLEANMRGQGGTAQTGQVK